MTSPAAMRLTTSSGRTWILAEQLAAGMKLDSRERREQGSHH